MMKRILSKKRAVGMVVAASIPFAAVAASKPVAEDVDGTCYAAKKKATKKPAPTGTTKR